MPRTKDGELIELFVYGTLRTGQPLHDWVAEDVFRKCEATTPGHLYELRNGEYPAALFDPTATNRIHGEVMTVVLTESVLGCIEMENAAGYACRWVEVTFENGKTAKALSFEFTPMSGDQLGEQIISGDWVEHLSKRHSELHEQDLEFMATTLGQLVTGDSELYHEIIDIILDDFADDPEMNDEVAMSDLELMLYNPKYVTELRDYITQAVANLNESATTPEDNDTQSEN